jgi:nitrogen fixation NifU-like protein
MEDELTPQEHEMYMQQLMDNYQNPKNYGKLENYTLFSHQKNITCGDTFDIYIKLNDNNIIEDVKFNGEGCAISTASFSLLTQKLKGMSLENAKKISEKDLKKLLGIKVSPGRMNCALLSFRALEDSLKNS